MNLKGLLFIGFLVLTILANAQTNFKPGYVTKAIGDTLFGEIDHRGDQLMSEVCRFRLNDSEKDIKYYPKDIVGYRFKDDRYYISKDLNGNKIFLEYLIKGRVSVYYLRDNEGDHYFLDKEGLGIAELKYEEKIKEINGQLYDYKSEFHFGLLLFYMQDVPNFQSRIVEMGKPEHQSLIKLAEDYNSKICKDESCIVYEKKIPLFKCNLEIVGGLINYQGGEDTDYEYVYKGQNHFRGGVLAHLWLPRTNENLFFRTGILYSNQSTTKGDKTIVIIPLQIEYVYPKGIFAPKMAIGLNMDNHMTQALALMAGFNIKVNKKVAIGVSYDIDFTKDPNIYILPRGIHTQTFLAGLYFNL